MSRLARLRSWPRLPVWVHVCVAVALALALGAPALAAEPSAASSSSEWNFRVLLDGKLIGHHRFAVSSEGEERTVHSDASFAVKILGITAYRYQHSATELWHGDCLIALNSTTNDDGKHMSVHLDPQDPALVPVATNARSCVMSFAYWNPAIEGQSRLLNAQTGKLEDVRITRLAQGLVEVHGQPTAAMRLRITGAEQPIDVCYSMQGDWIGLDSKVAGGRTLSYRLGQ